MICKAGPKIVPCGIPHTFIKQSSRFISTPKSQPRWEHSLGFILKSPIYEAENSFGLIKIKRAQIIAFKNICLSYFCGVRTLDFTQRDFKDISYVIREIKVW